MRPANLIALLKLGLAFRRLGPDGQKAVEILTGAANPILDRWFESEQLKATIATDAIIGAFATPSMPGTAYVLFHHVMGECNGVRGVWGYVRGGMGGLSNAIASAAKEKGAEIRTNAAVSKIVMRMGRRWCR
jgi:phytoene dehydrogenase-like protein